MINTGSPGLNHMENEIVIENEIVFGIKIKKEWRVSIRKVYANDRVKTIYDLREWFRYTDQLDHLSEKGWTRFDEFMDANPGRVFDNDGHLYNAFRLFSLKATKSEKLFPDLEESETDY